MTHADPAPDGRDAILTKVMNSALCLTEGWDRDFADPITEETLLVADLGCQSLDIVVLTADLTRLLGRRDLPLEKLLLVGGKPVMDISLGTLADFLWEHTKKQPTREGGNAA